LSTSPVPRFENSSSVAPSERTKTFPGTPVLAVRLFMPLTNASKKTMRPMTAVNANAVMRFVFQRTRTLRRLYASGTLPSDNRTIRSTPYMTRMTNGQCSTIAGGTFSWSGVFRNSRTLSGIFASASSRFFSVWPRKLAGAGRKNRATTANEPFSGNGMRVTTSTDTARSAIKTTRPDTIAKRRVSVRRSHVCRSDTVSLRTDSCGTRAGKARSRTESGKSERARTTAVPISRRNRRQIRARIQTVLP
jgi:hypothetical protein